MPQSRLAGLRGALCAMVLAWGSGAPSPATAEYELRQGDTVSVSIHSVLGLVDEAMVDLDGTITVPIAGRVMVEGRSIAHVQEDIAQAVAASPFRYITSGGEEVWLNLQPSDVLVQVAAYAPVFATGMVAQPGLVVYLPGMTVRQLVAQTGGIRMLLLDPQAADRLAIDLEAARTVAERRLATSRAVVARLGSEIASLDEAGGTGGPADEVASGDLGDLGRQIVASGEAQRTQEAETLRGQLDEMRERLAVLQDRLEGENELVALDRAEADRIADLAERGLIPTGPRVEAERSLMFSASNSLDTLSETALLRIEIARLGGELSLLPARDRRQLLGELERAQGEAEATQAELESISQRLAGLGRLPDEEADAVELTLHRFEDGESVSRLVSLDERLLPGDVVEVAVPRPDLGD